MKRTPLLAATAVLTVLLATGLAQAKATTETAPAAPAAVMEKMDKTPVKGPMAMPKLSEATHKMMQEVMNTSREENKAVFDEMETKHKEMQEIMKAATFDKRAFLAKHEEIQTLRAKLDSSRSEAMAGVLEKMSVEERAQMGGMGMMMGRGHGKGMHRMGNGGPMEDCPMMGRGDEAPAVPAIGKKK